MQKSLVVNYRRTVLEESYIPPPEVEISVKKRSAGPISKCSTGTLGSNCATSTITQPISTSNVWLEEPGHWEDDAYTEGSRNRSVYRCTFVIGETTVVDQMNKGQAHQDSRGLSKSMNENTFCRLAL